MRAHRSVRLRSKKKSKEIMDIDITSLLDILVIMLVFLLQSYNSSGIIINVPKGVMLPTSESETQSSSGVIVQVSPTSIWVDDVLVFDTEKDGRMPKDQGGRRIIPLFNELVKKKQAIGQLEQSAPQAIAFSGVVNLLVDKTVRYTELKSIMYTAASAGFKQYKFVVLGEDN